MFYDSHLGWIMKVIKVGGGCLKGKKEIAAIAERGTIELQTELATRA